jgi:hypothetical protein
MEYTPPLKPEAMIEFWATEDDSWRIKDWPGLSEKFSLMQSEVEGWFKAVSGQGRAWNAIRGIYQVHPLLVSSPEEEEEQVPKTITDVVRTMDCTRPVLEKEIAALVQFWNKARAAAQLQKKIDEAPAQRQSEELNPYINSDLDTGKVEELLQKTNLSQLKEPALRIYVAGRILDLQDHLNDKSTQTIARQILRNEISAWNQEKHIDYLANRKLAIEDSGKPEKDIYRDLSKLQEDIQKADKHLATIQDKITKGIAAIGADQMDEFQAKRTWTSAFSEIIDRQKQYYANPENLLMDGVFTPAEIEFQMTPTDFRPPQYRPDFVATINEAMKPENLWNPEFKSKSPGRAATRMLLKIVTRIGEEALAEKNQTSVTSEEEEEPDIAPSEVEPNQPHTPAPNDPTPQPQPPRVHQTHRKKTETFLA